jgi:hypothetical protein
MRVKHLEGGSFSNGFVLSSGKEDSIDIGYCTIVIVPASPLNTQTESVAAVAKIWS